MRRSTHRETQRIYDWHPGGSWVKRMMAKLVRRKRKNLPVMAAVDTEDGGSRLGNE